MSAPPRSLSTIAVDVLESCVQHRLLTTVQLHDLHRPARRIRATQQLLAKLRDLDLLATAGGRREPLLWYATERGAATVEAVAMRAETRHKLISPEQAAGPLRHHTVAVNDVGLAFVRAARQRGDDCGPQSWRHEIAHPLGPPPGQHASEQLIADALLTYQHNDDEAIRFHYRFIELDRATMPVDTLADKLARYARLYRYAGRPTARGDARALWTHRYTVFPGVLLVLAGDTRDRLQRRRRIVLDLCAADRQLTATQQVKVTCCLLNDLRDQGPFAEIFHRPEAPKEPTDWLRA